MSFLLTCASLYLLSTKKVYESHKTMRSSLATRFWLFFSSLLFFIVLLCPKPWVPWQFQTRTKKTKKALLLSSMETQLDLVLNQLRLCRNHQQIMVSLFRHIFQSMYLSKYVLRYVRPGGTFSNQGGCLGIICSHDWNT